MPGVRIYPYKEVESGSHIHESLIWESRAAAALRSRRRRGARERRPHAGGCSARRCGARHCAQARREGRREQGVGARLPDDQARDDLRLHVGRARRRRPSRASRRRRTPPPEDGGLRGRRPRGHEPDRPRGRPDPLLRAARHAALVRAPEGDREELHARRAARAAFGDIGDISYPARVRESYAHDLLAGVDVEAIRDRGFRLVVDYGFSAASFVLPLAARPARRRGDLRARLHHRPHRQQLGVAAGDDRPGQAARSGGGSGPRRRPRPRRGAALPRGRERPRDPGRAEPPAVPPPARDRRAPGQARVPDHRHEPGRQAPRGERAGGRPDASLARRADEGGGGGRRIFAGAVGGATSSRSSSRPTTPSRASASSWSCWRRCAGRSRSSSRSCPPRPSSTASSLPVGDEGRRDAGDDGAPARPRLDLADGIKVFEERGWAQILPDADEPLFHIYAEGRRRRTPRRSRRSTARSWRRSCRARVRPQSASELSSSG